MIDKIKELKEELTPQILDKRLLWDFMKMKMREFIITFAKGKAKVRRLEIERLEKEIGELEKQLISTSPKSKIDEIENKNTTLSKLYDYSKQGVRVRSRAEWTEEGEQNIHYFEQLLKSNKNKTVIRQLYINQNDITSDKNKILTLIKDFYGELYSKKKEQ